MFYAYRVFHKNKKLVEHKSIINEDCIRMDVPPFGYMEITGGSGGLRVRFIDNKGTGTMVVRPHFDNEISIGVVEED